MNLFTKFPKYSYSRFLFENKKKITRKDRIKALNLFFYYTRDKKK